MRDVFVEGQCDQAVLRWFIDASCPNGADVAVYPIDEIDVSGEVLGQYGLTSGNRSEVIALCLELESKFSNELLSATGVIDRDVYSILTGDLESDLLLKSDFSCIEMNLFSDKCLTKTLKLVFPKVKRSAKQVTDQLAPVLRELFLMRAAVQSLGLGAKWIPFDNFVSVKGGVIEFRSKDFHREFLQKGGVWHRRAEFDAKIKTLREMLPGDFRFEAQGHDAVCLLGLFLKAFYQKVKDTDKTCPHILVHFLTCSLELTDMTELPMFQRLAQRIA